MDAPAAPGDDPPASSSRSAANSISIPGKATWLEIRLFYIRVSPCPGDAVPVRLMLSHLPRDRGSAIEVNGVHVPSSDPTSLQLRCDRLDPRAGEVTYVCTDGVRIAGAVDFEVCDDLGTLILCGSLGRLDASWCNGPLADGGNAAAGWEMECYTAASMSTTAFVQPKMGISSPSMEVYVAGCLAGAPLVLTQTVHLSPKRKPSRPGMLDTIPEGEEAASSREMVSGIELNRGQTILAQAGDGLDQEEHDKFMHRYYPEGWYAEEDDSQLSWFNAGVRVGVGIGLGICVGVGIGVGLLMRSYQATTRTFRRRLF